MLSDWELWACAKQQLDLFGDTAPEMAAMRADELLTSGDIAGSKTWLEILSRIRQMTAVQPGEAPN